MAHASFLYCAFSVAQHNELNEIRGGRKLNRFGFPIRGKKTSIENRDMDQWRRKHGGNDENSHPLVHNSLKKT